MKLSSAKVTAPGPKQVFRRPGCADVIALAGERPPDGGRPLLETVMRDGRRTGPGPTLDQCRERLTADLQDLPPAARRIRAPVAPRAAPSERLGALAARVRRRIEERTTAASARSTVPERTVSGPRGPAPR
ncbi:hypothetical protein [Streptomyces griseoflavus]|nr:hypothetical protein [Streptomyces griseoflavus]